MKRRFRVLLVAVFSLLFLLFGGKTAKDKIYINYVIPPLSWIQKEDNVWMKKLYLGMPRKDFLNIMKKEKHFHKEWGFKLLFWDSNPSEYEKSYDTTPGEPEIVFVYRIYYGKLDKVYFYFKLNHSPNIYDYRDTLVRTIQSFIRQLGEPVRIYHTILHPKYDKSRSSNIVMQWNINSDVRLDFCCTPVEDLQGNDLTIHFRVGPKKDVFVSKEATDGVDNKIEETPFIAYIEEARRLNISNADTISNKKF